MLLTLFVIFNILCFGIFLIYRDTIKRCHATDDVHRLQVVLNYIRIQYGMSPINWSCTTIAEAEDRIMHELDDYYGDNAPEDYDIPEKKQAGDYKDIVPCKASDDTENTPYEDVQFPDMTGTQFYLDDIQSTPEEKEMINGLRDFLLHNKKLENWPLLYDFLIDLYGIKLVHMDKQYAMAKIRIIVKGDSEPYQATVTRTRENETTGETYKEEVSVFKEDIVPVIGEYFKDKFGLNVIDLRVSWFTLISDSEDENEETDDEYDDECSEED